jgi:hypothetical protein
MVEQLTAQVPESATQGANVNSTIESGSSAFATFAVRL